MRRTPGLLAWWHKGHTWYSIRRWRWLHLYHVSRHGGHRGRVLSIRPLDVRVVANGGGVRRVGHVRVSSLGRPGTVNGIWMHVNARGCEREERRGPNYRRLGSWHSWCRLTSWRSARWYSGRRGLRNRHGVGVRVGVGGSSHQSCGRVHGYPW